MYTPPGGGYILSTYVVCFPRAQRAESFPRARINSTPVGRSIYVRETGMPPLPPDTTARLWLDYTVCGYQHTLQTRLGVGVDPADGITEMAAFMSAIGPNCRLITVAGARYAVALSNVSNPIDWTGDTTYGADAGSAYESAQYVDFVGRSIDGRRVRVAVFGYIASHAGVDYRVQPEEDTNVDNAVTVLRLAEGTFVSINGFQPTWYNYANVGVNAYWRNHIR